MSADRDHDGSRSRYTAIHAGTLQFTPVHGGSQ